MSIFGHEEDIFDESRSISNTSAALQFFQDKLCAIKMHNYETKSFKGLLKFFRKKLNLNKSPNRKGYRQFFTEEEKR